VVVKTLWTVTVLLFGAVTVVAVVLVTVDVSVLVFCAAGSAAAKAGRAWTLMCGEKLIAGRGS